MILRRPLPILALLLAGLAACDDSPSATDDSIVGTWTLVSVNGEPPPAVLFTFAGVTTEVLSASLEVRSGGTCTLRAELRTTDSTGTSTSNRADECTWSRNGSAAFFTFESGAAFELLAATVVEDEMTVNQSGVTLVLRR
ncbi:MAG TPA: hypothetical protein VK849_00985 [Longimicrobiales bacterium]|nr:hypothetical protein [Longimicrobiales bacterium]